MTHIWLGGTWLDKKKDRRFEPCSPGFISQRVKGVQG